MDRVTDQSVGTVRALGIVLVCATVLGACGQRDDTRLLFDGVYFRTKSTSARDDRQSFSVRVPRADQSITGARAAGQHEGMRYCITNFGTSDIDWINGPDAEDGRLNLENNALKLSGRCITW